MRPSLVFYQKNWLLCISMDWEVSFWLLTLLGISNIFNSRRSSRWFAVSVRELCSWHIRMSYLKKLQVFISCWPSTESLFCIRNRAWDHGNRGKGFENSTGVKNLLYVLSPHSAALRPTAKIFQEALIHAWGAFVVLIRNFTSKSKTLTLHMCT